MPPRKKKGKGKNKNKKPVKVLGVKRADALDFAPEKGLERPPLMSSDPALEAERRALQRGVQDLFRDTRREVGRAKEDRRTSVTDLRRMTGRARKDLTRGFKRGTADLAREKQRLGQDYSMALADIFHANDVTAQQQAEAANAAGVLGGSTAAASAAARAGNLQRARQPLDTSLQRGTQDIATERRRLGQDTRLGKRQLRQDKRFDMNLIQRDYSRFRQDARTGLQRGIREQRIGDIDITNQQIFNARQLFPGAFSKTGAPTGKKKNRLRI